MKRLFALIMILVMTLSMAACAGVGSTPNASGKTVYTGAFTVTKFEVFLVAGEYRYVMAVKNDDFALLFTVNSATYLKYEIGDTVSGEVKCSGQNNYYIQLNESEEWLDAIETIGFKD